MTRQAKLGGDFSRWDARGLPDGKLGGPDGSLRALASVQRVQESVEAEELEGALRTVPPRESDPINTTLAGVGADSEAARAPAEVASNDDQVLPLVQRLAVGWMVVRAYELDGTQFVVAQRHEAPPQGPRALSAREREALRLALGKDITNKIIAFEMGISASTVGVLLHRAKYKLGCRTRAELLARFQVLQTAEAPATKP
jgi:DNA-binding CsgD family transcriptional regulator